MAPLDFQHLETHDQPNILLLAAVSAFGFFFFFTFYEHYVLSMNKRALGEKTCNMLEGMQ